MDSATVYETVLWKFKSSRGDCGVEESDYLVGLIIMHNFESRYGFKNMYKLMLVRIQPLATKTGHVDLPSTFHL